MCISRIGTFFGSSSGARGLFVSEFGDRLCCNCDAAMKPFASAAFRRGSEELLASDITRKRITTYVKNAYCEISHNSLCGQAKPQFLPSVTFEFASVGTGVVLISLDSSPTIDFDFKAPTRSAIFVMASQSSQGSQAFPPSPLLMINSEIICPTRDVKHPFLRSSGGSSTARVLCTNS